MEELYGRVAGFLSELSELCAALAERDRALGRFFKVYSKRVKLLEPPPRSPPTILVTVGREIDASCLSGAFWLQHPRRLFEMRMYRSLRSVTVRDVRLNSYGLEVVSTWSYALENLHEVHWIPWEGAELGHVAVLSLLVGDEDLDELRDRVGERAREVEPVVARLKEVFGLVRELLGGVEGGSDLDGGGEILGRARGECALDELEKLGKALTKDLERLAVECDRKVSLRLKPLIYPVRAEVYPRRDVANVCLLDLLLRARNVRFRRVKRATVQELSVGLPGLQAYLRLRYEHGDWGGLALTVPLDGTEVRLGDLVLTAIALEREDVDWLKSEVKMQTREVLGIAAKLERALAVLTARAREQFAL